jgi:hypothetical protein
MGGVGCGSNPIIGNEMIMMILAVLVLCPGILGNIGGLLGGDNSMFIIIVLLLLFSGGKF